MNILHAILFRVVIVVVGIPAHVVFRLLRSRGFIRVEGVIPHSWNRGLLVVSNHPSYLEPLLYIFLFFENFSRDLEKGFPWSTPDPRGLPNKWWLLLLWWVPLMRIVGFNRSKGMHRRNLLRIAEILRMGQITILFPEGGTTQKGDRFVTSTNGARLRKLRRGAQLIIREAECTVLPVWVDGPVGKSPRGMFGRRIRIKIGQPTQSITTTEDLERALITLGEQLEPAT